MTVFLLLKELNFDFYLSHYFERTSTYFRLLRYSFKIDVSSRQGIRAYMKRFSLLDMSVLYDEI